MKPMIKPGATLSKCGTYRYLLSRDWSTIEDVEGMPPRKRRLLWVMLNPSTADATQDDQTIRKVIAFSMRWGFDMAEVVNVFAFRATDPKVLQANYPQPEERWERVVGPENARYIREAAWRAEKVIVGWGANETVGQGDLTVKLLQEIHPHNIFCLGRTKSGAPKHPLYLKLETKLELYASPYDKES
jgi:hypothetical protein